MTEPGCCVLIDEHLNVISNQNCQHKPFDCPFDMGCGISSDSERSHSVSPDEIIDICRQIGENKFAIVTYTILIGIELLFEL